MRKAIAASFYLMGLISLGIIVADSFFITIPFINENPIKHTFRRPEFDVSSVVFLLIAFVCFYHKRVSNLIDRIRISKLTMSKVEIQLDYLDQQLTGSNERKIKDGLKALLEQKLKDIQSGLASYVQGMTEFKALSATLQKRIINRPEGCASFLLTYGIIRAEFLSTWLGLHKMQWQILGNDYSVNFNEISKSIGIAILLEKEIPRAQL
ncbi:hypothetical protein [Mucilaginibacter sp.]|uniref:hypothetical protein n=1 Tax=Mucilaginibacter sp. TaxID=1882438 RepID=UPI002CE0FDE9|nr:hypothetical protein [Mucilaginibacter sp.]HTI59701.1 hypothetical protein [Mucilaginibacter sp.]